MPSTDTMLGRLWRGARQRIGGIAFVAGDPSAVASALIHAAADPQRAVGEHVHLVDAWGIASSGSDPDLTAVYTSPRGWALAQGRPLAWLSALRRGRLRLWQVRGPELLLEMADRGRDLGVRHWFIGSDPDLLQQVRARLEARLPGVEIAGVSAQTARRATLLQVDRRDAEIERAGAQVVWIGHGTTAQDFEAARIAAALPVVAIAVGDAFEYVAGRRRPVPRWVRPLGMEWAWRLVTDPRRRWGRAAVGNLRFLGRVGGAALQRRRSARFHDARERAAATVVVGQLPPPLHGSAVMTQRLIEAVVELHGSVAVVDRRFSRSVAEVGAVGVRKLLAVPSLLVRFVRAAAGHGTVIVLITTRPATFLLDVLLLRLARRPAVLYVHTVGFRELAQRGPLWRRLVEHALGGASRVVVLGASLVDDVAPFVEPGRVAVIPNCTTEIEPYARTAGARLLFLSNLLPGKGADAFVRLAARLRQERPDIDWSFDLAGAGDPSGLPSLPAGTVLHGRVEGLRKDELLKDADLLVLPSTYAMEAQPLVIVEAMSYGLPVVAYDNGGIRDLVDVSTGALVEKGDEEALLQAVLALVAEPERLQQARGIARRRHRERHSLTAYREAWRSVLGLPPVIAVGAPARPHARDDSMRPLAGTESSW